MLKIFEFELPVDGTGHFALEIPDGAKFLSIRTGITTVVLTDGTGTRNRIENYISFLADADAKLRLYDFWMFKAGDPISEGLLNPPLKEKPTYLGVLNDNHYWWRDGAYWGDDSE